MTCLEKIREEHADLASVLKKHKGIRKTVEELYPDKSHFIYELLQNAEDTKATVVSFTLAKNMLSFEHNGRPFTENDVKAITDIGEGTKADDTDKIGRFGVGFKAVFAYSETPRVWSPTFCFEIKELVLPFELNSNKELDALTRFEFPFNNPKKTSDDAFSEIEAGLNDLDETTLLFLSSIKTIHFDTCNGLKGYLWRIEHSENHIEIVKVLGTKTTVSKHFLRFADVVRNLDKQHVAIAFALDFLPKITQFDPSKPLAEQFKIVPAHPGRVAVFFPAEKETSGLRFHIHAPFVPELSRASIKDTPVNTPLFQQLAQLAAQSLHTIRDLKLLTVEFLGSLPNNKDEIPERYKPIRTAIIGEMKAKPLTPTQYGSHAPARTLLQAKKLLKDLLSKTDLKFLVEHEGQAPQWAVAASQKNSEVDRFLDSLEIKEWDVSDFESLMEHKINEQSLLRIDKAFMTAFMTWLSGKPHDWHQQLYSLLYTEFGQNYSGRQVIERLKSVKLVRLVDGVYSIGEKCYFQTDRLAHDEILPRVDHKVYSSGKNETQQDQARKFLGAVGVRTVGEAELVEAILKKRYTGDAEKPDDATYYSDLKLFIALLEKTSDKANLFSKSYVLKTACNDWRQPKGVFLDKPYEDTGLHAYYDALGKNSSKCALSEVYTSSELELKKFLFFLQSVGVQKYLHIAPANCYGNPYREELVFKAHGGWSDMYGINTDYTIENIRQLVSLKNIRISVLIWKTLCNQKDNNWIYAKYRNNSHHPVQTALSQLICALKEGAWVPQEIDNSVKFVKPADVDRAKLPQGFSFDSGSEWIKVLKFGENQYKQAEINKQKAEEERINQQKLKETLGCKDDESFNRTKEFAALSAEEQTEVLNDIKRKKNFTPPTNAPQNPERRAQKLREDAANKPLKSTRQSNRSVPDSEAAPTKEEAKQYLRTEYNTSDGMWCQICHAPLPFKLDDGNYYFEAVPFVKTLARYHRENYLALCPNHSAMFEHANGSKDKLLQLLHGLPKEQNELRIILAKKEVKIWFTETHLADLRNVVDVDKS